MARKIFFSFHYERDSWRAGNVRSSDQITDSDEKGFIDKVEWEKLERTGSEAIKRWINTQMDGTTVTVVLIGAETASRPWVKYEIEETLRRKNGLIGVHIHSIRDTSQRTDVKGADPVNVGRSGYKIYDWNTDNGRENLGTWVEQAYQRSLSRK